jgi:ribonuclease E
MSRKMLINVLHPEEARVAIVQDGRLMELNIEISGKEQTKGNIYKGVVVRVEPGLQAAFVDIGHKKPGFIQMGDLHPDSWQWRDDLPEEERKRRPRIQDVVRRGQELIVQVEKDARDMKGAALTSYLSLPGRYMVLMPGDDAAGISRKIEDNAIRKELKALVAELQVPTGYGYIVRTEAVGRSSVELKKDLDYLIGVHERILQQAAAINGAGEVYQDAGVIIRTIRDYFSDDIDEVLVDDKSACQQAVDFFKEIMPGCERLVKLHKEKRPIFSKYQLEEQIDQLYEKRVPLPSGGSLIIEPTEALVSIDVNSGKSSGEKGVEDTAFKTNLEAAAEVARQLRLRDLGGLVVIDFIDMRDNKHNKEVERTLKDALKMDKARVNLGRISQFGMMEMSRQRIAKNINDAIHLECPHCEGRGRVKSVEAMAVSFLRKVHAAAAKGQLAEVHGALPLDVAYYLLNRKKRELTQIENDYEIVVTVKGKPSFLLNQLELEAIRKEKTVREEEVVQELAVADIVESTVEDEVVAEGAALSAVDSAAKKKRKRRRKKKSAGERQIEQVADEVVDVIDNAAGSAMADVASEAVVTADLVSPDTPVRKRPRRTRAKKKDIQQGTVASKVIDETTVAEDVTELGDQTLSVPKKRSRQRKSTRNEMADILVIDNVAAEQTVANKPSPPKKSRSKKALPQNDETSEVGVMAEQLVTDLTEPIKQVKKKASVRQKKVESLSDVPTEE